MSFATLVLAGPIGSTELFIIFGIILLLFGGSKLPSLAKGLGQSVKEFKKASKDEDEEKIVGEVKKTETTTTSNPSAGTK